MQPTAMTCTPSIPTVTSGNIRPLSSPLNSGVIGALGRVAGNPTSPHAVHSTVGGAHVPIANFQATFFATPHAPLNSSSPANTSVASSINSTVSHLPLVSYTTAVIAAMATVTTTTSSISTLGNTEPTVATVSAVVPTPHPFSAESLFQPSKNDQADLLRRELDSRFLDRSGLTQPSPSSSSTYMRQDLHHQHTHMHQHPQLLSTAPMSASSTVLPATPPNPAQIFPPPLFKDIPKIAAVDQQFYRASIGIPPGYTGYNPTGLLHNGLGGPTPFVPPNHLPSFAPKVSTNKLKIFK
ncbi:autism susceptibility gene 2 protein homolog [Drosophila navojoa]|uniref:autism susceptibility gene 2 protein homolog n=1 Tax=Drosophila navojoa TaxID=7232 RepID=UPI0008476591|nr:autism susceptibility gene 2 protein homolog [Drosophila navojoa]